MTILRISECQLLDIIWNHLVLVLAFDLQFIVIWHDIGSFSTISQQVSSENRNMINLAPFANVSKKVVLLSTGFYQLMRKLAIMSPWDRFFFLFSGDIGKKCSLNIKTHHNARMQCHLILSFFQLARLV